MNRIAGVTLLLLSNPLFAEQWFETRRSDQPVAIAATGIVKSSDVQRFGTPPNRNWQTSITYLIAEGTRVQPGDVLARFDGSMQDNRIRELTGALERSQGELASLIETQTRQIEDEKVTVAAAESLAKRAARKAEQPEGLIAGIDYSKLVEEKRIAHELAVRAKNRVTLTESLRDASRKEVEAKIRRTEIQLKAAQAELDAFTVRAPREGLAIIGTDSRDRKFDVNMNVHPGLVIVEVVDDSVLEIHAGIPEHASAKLQPGQQATIVVDTAGGTEIQGSVIWVASTVRRQSKGTLAMIRDVIISLPTDPAGQLRLGQSVMVNIHADRLTDVLWVPEAAISYRDGYPGVTTRTGWQPVTLGPRTDGKLVILDGLDENQEVRI